MKAIRRLAVLIPLFAGPAAAYDSGDVTQFSERSDCYQYDLRFLEANEASMIHVSAPESDLRGASFAGSAIDESNFTRADMTGIDLTGARMRFNRLTNSVLRRATMGSADLIGVMGQQADFTDARLDGANFGGADLRYAVFTGATLQGTRFFAADLRGAVGLTQAQLDLACGDESTRLSPRLTIDRCN